MKTRHMTSLLRKSGIVLGFSAFTSLPLMAADPAFILPDESVAYAEMDSTAMAKLESHPVTQKIPLNDIQALFLKISGQTVDDEKAMEKFIADEMGMSHEELEKKFGKFALTIHDLKVPDSNPQPENIGLEISVAGEMDGDEAFGEKYLRTMFKLIGQQVKKSGDASLPDIEELLKKAHEFVEHSTAEHGGAKIQVYKVKETEQSHGMPASLKEWAFAVHEKMFLLSSGQDGVEEMIDRIKSGGDAGSLAASALYKADHDKAGKTLALASMNLETIMSLVEKYGLPEADFGDADAKKVWKALGADKLKSAILALGATDNALDFTALLTHSAKPGLFGILAVPGEGKPPGFLPKDAVSASYQQIDLEDTIDNIAKLAGEMNPAWGGLMEMGMTMAQGQTGVDLRKEFLANLGPDVWTVTGKIEPAAEGKESSDEARMTALSATISKGVYGVRVKDAKAFGNALKTLINSTGQAEGLFDDQEYQGFTVRKIKAVPAPMTVSYVLTDDWFILNLNDQGALEQVLGNLKKEGTEGFFSDKSVSGLLEGMRGGAISSSVTDLGAMLTAMAEMIGGIAELSGEEEAKSIPFDEIKKLAKLPLWLGNKIWIEDSATEIRFRLAPKE